MTSGDQPDRPWEREVGSQISPVRPPAVLKARTPPWVWIAGILAPIVLFATVAIVVQNSGNDDEVAYVPVEFSACEKVLSEVDIAQQHHYDTHPAFDDGFTYASPDAEAILADEEAKWAALIEPIYFGCDGADELWDAVQKFPAIAGLTDFLGLDLYKERKIFLDSYCSGREDTPSCEGA